MIEVQDSNRERLLGHMPRGAVCCEVGVLDGKFARQILDRTRPALLYLIDCWSVQPTNPDPSGRETIAEHDAHYEATCRMVESHQLRDRVVIRRGWSHEVLPAMAAGLLDWIYIDACHTYEACLADLHAAARIVKHGGLIAGHDYEAGTQWAESHQCGVVQAVRDFCSEAGWRLTHVFRDSARNNSYVLRRVGDE